LGRVITSPYFTDYRLLTVIERQYSTETLSPEGIVEDLITHPLALLLSALMGAPKGGLVLRQ
jgi:hypothetical protein